MTTQAQPQTASENPIFDGCIEHHVGTMDVNKRWALPTVTAEVLLGMCWCCYGPCLVDGFDVRGVGYGELLCSKCRLAEGVR